MNGFSLDSRLDKDCITLGRLDLSMLLLMDNSHVPWFILVPETPEIEIIDLSHPDQARLLKEINLVSGFVRNEFECTKLNIAAIGNIVNQLHIHIIGRNPSDFCWPNVVWGTKECKPYTDNQLKKITSLLKRHLGGQYTATSLHS